MTFLWLFLHFLFFFFFSSSTVVGDRTPGGSTPSITSITNIILLPQHDGEKFQHGDSEESIFSCPTLNRTLQLVVTKISVQPQILICSFWLLVWNQFNLVAIVWNRTIFFYCGTPVDQLCLKAQLLTSSWHWLFHGGFFNACYLWRQIYISMCDFKFLILGWVA